MINNFLNSNSNAAFDARTNNIYQQLQQLQSTPVNNFRTVFNDISDEWSACNEEERKFIEQDTEYLQANLAYAQQFNAFLIEQFGLQFSNSKYGSSAEKVLLSIRNAKGRYHTAATEDVKRIKEENIELQRQIKELEDLINGK